MLMESLLMIQQKKTVKENKIVLIYNPDNPRRK